MFSKMLPVLPKGSMYPALPLSIRSTPLILLSVNLVTTPLSLSQKLAFHLLWRTNLLSSSLSISSTVEDISYRQPHPPPHRFAPFLVLLSICVCPSFPAHRCSPSPPSILDLLILRLSLSWTLTTDEPGDTSWKVVQLIIITSGCRPFSRQICRLLVTHLWFLWTVRLHPGSR